MQYVSPVERSSFLFPRSLSEVDNADEDADADDAAADDDDDADAVSVRTLIVVMPIFFSSIFNYFSPTQSNIVTKLIPYQL